MKLANQEMEKIEKEAINVIGLKGTPCLFVNHMTTRILVCCKT